MTLNPHTLSIRVRTALSQATATHRCSPVPGDKYPQILELIGYGSKDAASTGLRNHPHEQLVIPSEFAHRGIWAVPGS